LLSKLDTLVAHFQEIRSAVKNDSELDGHENLLAAIREFSKVTADWKNAKYTVHSMGLPTWFREPSCDLCHAFIKEIMPGVIGDKE